MQACSLAPQLKAMTALGFAEWTVESISHQSWGWSLYVFDSTPSNHHPAILLWKRSAYSFSTASRRVRHSDEGGTFSLNSPRPAAWSIKPARILGSFI